MKNEIERPVADGGTTKLLRPVDIGAWRLRNRVVMAPLTRCRAIPDRIPNALMAEYYRQRAGAGMIIAEATAVDPMGVGYPNTPGIWSEEQIAGWKMVTKAVHDAGGLILLQLWHVGRISDPVYLGGKLPVAPSAIPAAGHVSLLRPKRPYPTPRPLETDEISGIVEAYRRGAENAKAAGFDGVHIHAANGYLIDQFLQDSTNHRTDRYGGSIENRTRFLLEIVDALGSVWAAERIGVHLRPRGEEHDMGDSKPRALFGHVAEKLRDRVGFLFIRERQTPDSQLGRIKEIFGGPVIANDEMTPTDAEHLIEAGTADAVGFGRLFIANPDLPHRFFLNAPLNAQRSELFYGSGAAGYTDYPFLEATQKVI